MTTPLTAFDMEFPVWPPPVTPHVPRTARPVGSVRLVRSSPTSRAHLQIKVYDEGCGAAWMRIARFWWLKNKGPLESDQQVSHIDGDYDNHDPSNYALMSAGDRAVCHALDDPKWAAWQRRCTQAPRIEVMREMAQIRRLRQWRTSLWYPVDADGGRILNDPRGSQREVYAAHGFTAAYGDDPAVLGWPGVELLGAQILVVLRAGPCRTPELQARLAEFARRRGWPASPQKHSVYSRLWSLRSRGYVASKGQGQHDSIHRLTPAGVAARGPVCPIVAVRGRRLDSPPFNTFTRVDVCGHVRLPNHETPPQEASFA